MGLQCHSRSRSGCYVRRQLVHVLLSLATCAMAGFAEPGVWPGASTSCDRGQSALETTISAELSAFRAANAECLSFCSPAQGTSCDADCSQGLDALQSACHSDSAHVYRVEEVVSFSGGVGQDVSAYACLAEACNSADVMLYAAWIEHQRCAPLSNLSFVKTCAVSAVMDDVISDSEAAARVTGAVLVALAVVAIVVVAGLAWRRWQVQKKTNGLREAAEEAEMTPILPTLGHGPSLSNGGVPVVGALVTQAAAGTGSANGTCTGSQRDSGALGTGAGRSSFGSQSQASLPGWPAHALADLSLHAQSLPLAAPTAADLSATGSTAILSAASRHPDSAGVASAATRTSRVSFSGIAATQSPLQRDVSASEASSLRGAGSTRDDVFKSRYGASSARPPGTAPSAAAAQADGGGGSPANPVLAPLLQTEPLLVSLSPDLRVSLLSMNGGDLSPAGHQAVSRAITGTAAVGEPRPRPVLGPRPGSRRY